MENLQTIVAQVIGIAVTFFVPALVWATVIAGLVQIIREKTQKTHLPAERSQLPTRVGW